MRSRPVTETPNSRTADTSLIPVALGRASATCAGGTCPPSAPFYPPSPERDPTPALGREGRAAVPPSAADAPRGFSRFLAIAGPVLGDLIGALSLFVILFAGLFLGVILP